jgi:hypothetical protein
MYVVGSLLVVKLQLINDRVSSFLVSVYSSLFLIQVKGRHNIHDPKWLPVLKKSVNAALSFYEFK